MSQRLQSSTLRQVTTASPTLLFVIGLLLGTGITTVVRDHQTTSRAIAGVGTAGVSGLPANGVGTLASGTGAGAAAPGASPNPALSGSASASFAAAGAGGGATFSGGGPAATTGVGTTPGSLPASGLPGTPTGIRGVTSSTVKIAVVYANLGALAALGPAYNNGNIPEQWGAVLDGWKRAGLLPIAGRNIQLSFENYNVLDTSAQRASCVAAVQDDQAFTVVGSAYFDTGDACVTHDFHTPLITSDGPESQVYANGAPWLFSIDESTDRQLDNFVLWANANHLLQGRKIGLYYANDADTVALIGRTVKAQLAQLGYKVTAEDTTGDGLGGPEDAIAVEKFRSAGVDLALLFTSKTGFMQQAQAQGYRPTYLDSDYLYGTADVTTSTYPAQEYDGTYGITTQSTGEEHAGIAVAPTESACVAQYERYSGQKVDPTSAVYGYVLMACDEGAVLMAGLRGAGTDLTPTRFVAAIQSSASWPLNRYLTTGSYSASKHDATDFDRTLRWHASCTCWYADGPVTRLPLDT